MGERPAMHFTDVALCATLAVWPVTLGTSTAGGYG
jgi:hypothetical protein